MRLKEVAVEIFLSSIRSVHPENIIPQNLSLTDNLIKIKDYEFPLEGDLYVFGSGKASVEMAKAVEKILGDRIKEGVVVCNYTEKLEKIDVVEGSHPVPTEKSVKAGELLLERISALKENDTFIYLLSGGSSALIEKPIPPVTIQDLQKTTHLLLENSIPIDEINVVRKHLSLIKGGRLGEKTKGRGIVLVLSDVIGDDLFTIGSAPLYYDRSTYEDAYNILKKYNIFDKIPDSVKKVIQDGISGKIPDTPKSENPNIKHFIIGSNFIALNEAKRKAEESGYRSYIFTSLLKGEAREVAKVITGIGLEIKRSDNPVKKPVCILFGGETTVTVTGNGKGGRNQELVLSALKEIKDTNGIVLLSGGTDGIDGNSDAAGAVITADSYRKALSLDLNIDQYLENNDSYSFFKKTGDLIFTGKTGTNVMDIIVMIVEG
ncbi:MAG TPA: glycerate kinase [Persephonella sp.]|uniref:Putative hydroxypyruvate reductase n=1 Tax=Persephonella marina (strain DSM 14350 / EX-H1) TaxID=123214 RepID=C0QRQ0_PERMH|nr:MULTISPECIES: glycerate kinase [Persephonella]ACO03115.1 putative hydroxypyruvate reductase [Persephonella marina EX-H1]HCB69091.1 glycerate kinase [Persephonella sp.]